LAEKQKNKKQIRLLSEMIPKTSKVYFKIQVISAIIGALTRVFTGETIHGTNGA